MRDRVCACVLACVRTRMPVYVCVCVLKLLVRVLEYCSVLVCD